MKRPPRYKVLGQKLPKLSQLSAEKKEVWRRFSDEHKSAKQIACEMTGVKNPTRRTIQRVHDMTAEAYYARNHEAGKPLFRPGEQRKSPEQLWRENNVKTAQMREKAESRGRAVFSVPELPWKRAAAR